MKFKKMAISVLVLACILTGCGNQGSNSNYNSYDNSYNNSSDSSANDDSSGETGESTDETVSDDTDMDYVPVSAYDGWWYVDDSTYEGSTLFTTLMVDAETLEWVAYDAGGFDFAKGTVEVTVGTDNALVLDFVTSGTVELRLIDGRLVTTDGVYYDQESTTVDTADDVSLYAGTWYEPSYEKYITLQEDGTYAFYTAGNTDSSGNPLPDQQGAFNSEVYTFTNTDGSDYSQREMNFDLGDGLINGLSMTLIDDAALLDFWSGSTYYIREDMIGQPQGDLASIHCTLILHRWSSELTGTCLVFETSGRVAMSLESSDGTLTELLSGAYTVDETGITVTWSDGSIDYLTLTETGVQIQSTEEVFEMK